MYCWLRHIHSLKQVPQVNSSYRRGEEVEYGFARHTLPLSVEVPHVTCTVSCCTRAIPSKRRQAELEERGEMTCVKEDQKGCKDLCTASSHAAHS
jgi:hypothetical protein